MAVDFVVTSTGYFDAVWYQHSLSITAFKTRGDASTRLRTRRARRISTSTLTLRLVSSLPASRPMTIPNPLNADYRPC